MMVVKEIKMNINGKEITVTLSELEQIRDFADRILGEKKEPEQVNAKEEIKVPFPYHVPSSVYPPWNEQIQPCKIPNVTCIKLD